MFLFHRGLLNFVIEFDLNDFGSLLDRSFLEKEVGTLPLEVKNYFACSRDTVYLTSETAKKIEIKHRRHLHDHELNLLPSALQKGLWIADRENACVVSYFHSPTSRRFICAVKITAARDRAFLTTFHRASKRQTAATLKRGEVIRSHWV
jgi:hypothetical protein